MPRRPVSVATVVFGLLVLATLAAFAWSQRLKRDPLVLDKVRFGVPASRSFTPNRDCRFDTIRIRFRMTQSDDAIVQVIKPGGKVVYTLARDRFLKRYTFSTFHWDGRTRLNRGPAPPGRYKLRVKMLGEDRVLVPPGAITLHEAPRRPTKSCDRSGALSASERHKGPGGAE